MDSREYVPRGLVIDRIARERGVRGAKAIADFTRQRAQELGFSPEAVRSRSTIGNYFYGDTVPDDDWLTLFARAFELTTEEMGELAFSHSFRAYAAA